MANTKSRGGKKQGAAHEPGGKQRLGVRGVRSSSGKRVPGQKDSNTTKTKKR